MSGVVGIFNKNKQGVSHRVLEQMLESIAHRGPDAQNLWVQDHIGLGHCMLWSTIASKTDHLPRKANSDRHVLTCDARIDNREELTKRLLLPTSSEQKLSDSQLILAAYEKWGDRCPEYLIGDYAFGLWDQTKNLLFCARDPMGVRPFYFFQSNSLFVFGSEIKALLNHPDVPKQLNETRVADCLTLIFEDQASTLYQHIECLPSGHALIVKPDSSTLTQYWHLDRKKELRLNSADDYADAFYEMFTESVRCRLRSAYPIGSTLSGGLDSSSIASTAHHLLRNTGASDLHTFSAIFPDLPADELDRIDERSFMNDVLNAGQYQAHFIRADQLSPLQDIDKILWHMDESCSVPNLYMHWAMYKKAREHGVRIFLDGVDGDATVSHGLGYLKELIRTLRWKTLLDEAKAISKHYDYALNTPSVIWKMGIEPMVPKRLKRTWHRLRGRPQPIWGAHTIINPEFAQRIGLEQRYRSLFNKTPPLRKERDDHWVGITSPLYPYALRIADQTSKAFEIETRYPFFDRRLIEFCLSLPPGQKLHKGWDRMVMRRAMKDRLPDSVQWRKIKGDLSPNFNRRLYESNHALIQETMHDPPSSLKHYMDLSAWNNHYERYKNNPSRYAHSAITVFNGVIFTRWFRQAGLHP